MKEATKDNKLYFLHYCVQKWALLSKATIWSQWSVFTYNEYCPALPETEASARDFSFFFTAVSPKLYLSFTSVRKECLCSSDGERICLQCRRPKFDPWVRKIPWRRAWQPTPVFFPGEPRGQRSLGGFSPWDSKESDLTGRRTLLLLLQCCDTFGLSFRLIAKSLCSVSFVTLF